MFGKSSTLFIASTTEEKEHVIKEFLLSDDLSTLVVIGKHRSDATLAVASLYSRDLYDVRVVLHQGFTSIIGHSNNTSIKVIYCQASLDNFAKALIAEYSPVVAFFD